MKLNYEMIIKIICEANNIDEEKLQEIYKDRDLKYISILLLKKYGCSEIEKMKDDFGINTKRTLKYNENKAQEKLLVNYGFRRRYFDMDHFLKNRK